MCHFQNRIIKYVKLHPLMIPIYFVANMTKLKVSKRKTLETALIWHVLPRHHIECYQTISFWMWNEVLSAKIMQKSLVYFKLSNIRKLKNHNNLGLWPIGIAKKRKIKKPFQYKNCSEKLLEKLSDVFLAVTWSLKD